MKGTAMRYQQRIQQVKNYYDQCARDYRRFDETTADETNPQHTFEVLRKISRSFGRKIKALDVGCGCGRSFHCLENVEHLVGVDISPHMLQEARTPLRAEQVRIPRIDLICANLFEMTLPEQSFDFVYSIGVLGEHSPFDLETCNQLYRLLQPGGVLFFTVVDSTSHEDPKNLKRRFAEFLYPVLPNGYKAKVAEKLKSFYLSESELQAVMNASQFPRYEIARDVCNAARWQGAHFECTAFKDFA